jgi:membrane protein
MMRGRDVLDLGHRSLRGWIADSAPSMGAALAFYTLLSLAPLLLVLVGLAGFFVGRDAAQDAMLARAAMLLGEDAAVGIESFLDMATASGGQGMLPALIGAVMVFVGSTTVFAELRSDLDRIWRAPRAEGGTFMRHIAARTASFLLLAVIGLLLVGSMVASTLLSTIGKESLELSEGVLHAAEFLISFVVVTLLFAALYKILPTRPVAWRDVWVGAAATSLLFWVGKLAIALYLAHAAVDSTFGAAAAVVMVILWVYYSAQVFFFGAELTKEYALYHGSRQHERRGRRLSDMNAPYEALMERARRLNDVAT